VGERYVNAKSYRIEAIEERTSGNELRRSWRKTLLKAIVMPGGRYRYEGHGGSGWSIYESEVPKRRLIDIEEMPTQTALHLLGIHAHRADGLNSAARFPEQTISVGG